MTDTCINYQTIMPAVRGEHLAYGDTGVVIYSNSVLGARSQFRGWAVGAQRRPHRPHPALRLSSRGAASREPDGPRGANAARAARVGRAGRPRGRLAGDYWRVPVLTGIDRVPGSDELKHFGAALASYGSVAMFHMTGITPKRGARGDVADPASRHGDHRRDGHPRFQAQYARGDREIDVVVFSAPQLSLIEMRQLAELPRRPAGQRFRSSPSPARR